MLNLHLWVSEAQNDQEIAERQAAKDRRAAQIQAIRDNTRYLSFPNGFRLQCTDCGGIFEVDGEILHAGALPTQTQALNSPSMTAHKQWADPAGCQIVFVRRIENVKRS